MEELAKNITLYISHAAEIIAALIIGISIIKAIITYTSFSIKKESQIPKEEIRVHFGSSVAIALELLLGADVLATAVAPDWNDIGQLAAIACIRTALNYFLEKELRHTKAVSNVKQ